MTQICLTVFLSWLNTFKNCDDNHEVFISRQMEHWEILGIFWLVELQQDNTWLNCKTTNAKDYSILLFAQTNAALVIGEPGDLVSKEISRGSERWSAIIDDDVDYDDDYDHDDYNYDDDDGDNVDDD